MRENLVRMQANAHSTAGPIRLICGNCGKEEKFENWKAAYEAGWDTVAWVGYNACDGCPGVSVYFPMLYCQEARQKPAMAQEFLQKAADETMKGEAMKGAFSPSSRPET